MIFFYFFIFSFTNYTELLCQESVDAGEIPADTDVTACGLQTRTTYFLFIGVTFLINLPLEIYFTVITFQYWQECKAPNIMVASRQPDIHDMPVGIPIDQRPNGPTYIDAHD